VIYHFVKTTYGICYRWCEKPQGTITFRGWKKDWEVVRFVWFKEFLIHRYLLWVFFNMQWAPPIAITINVIIRFMWSLLQKLGQLDKLGIKICYCDQIHSKIGLLVFLLMNILTKQTFSFLMKSNIFFLLFYSCTQIYKNWLFKFAITYCYQSVNVIKFQSDNNNRRPL